MGLPIPIEQIQQSILLIRAKKVMLDADLAKLYGVSTKRLNEQVKRNRDRFPGDFMFQLTAKEKGEVVAICDHLSRLKFSPRNALRLHRAWGDYVGISSQYSKSDRSERFRGSGFRQTPGNISYP